MMKAIFILNLLVLISFPGLGSAQAVDWKVNPDFKSRKAAMDISGAVCAGTNGKHKWCYAVNDETDYFHTFAIDGFTLVPGPRGRLIEKREEDDKEELDLEAVSYADGFVYMTGSHGHPRKKKSFNDGSFWVFRLPVKEKSGKPIEKFEDKEVVSALETSNKLGEIIDETDGLAEFSRKRLQENGANIEGIAVLGSTIFFGFRAPVQDAGAVVLQVSADRLFGDGSGDVKSHFLDLGSQYGIRDMAVAEGEILILTGGAQEQQLKPAVWSWSPGSPPRLLSVLDTPPSSKAETLFVLSAKKKKFDVVVMFDSRKNGAPTGYEIPRR